MESSGAGNFKTQGVNAPKPKMGEEGTLRRNRGFRSGLAFD